ncbi:hypothetical protein [Microbispora sp. H10830]|uniref:hypothetical protein n=1 Tax=Microbispora sp. H10830 TaxID=2729109 RepID=UPI001601E61A|nr:hypothetical protein [Microbispora sp. H10830]
MRGRVLTRVLTWAGGIAALGAGSALAVYLSMVGLDKADKLASVIGLFVGLAGLVVGVWGLLLTRQEPPAPASGAGAVDNPVDNPVDSPVDNAVDSAVNRAVRAAVHNEISGGTIHGPVIQGHTISGPVVSGPRPAVPDEHAGKD